MKAGTAGIRQTLQLMSSLARQGSRTIRIRKLATELTQHLLQHDYYEEACAIHNYVRDEIRYVRDIKSVETLHTTRALLNNKYGDCDDKAILMAALLLSIGHNPRFVAGAFDGIQYTHVWLQDKIKGRWLDMETTEALECGQHVPYNRNTKLLFWGI